MLQTTTGPAVVRRDILTEWKTDSKPKFEDEGEAIAKTLSSLRDAFNSHPDFHQLSWPYVIRVLSEAINSIHALEPDAPVAAAAGSAEPVGYWRKVISFQDDAEFLSPGRWEGLSKYDQGIYTPVYPAPPSPPPPNPVTFDEAAERNLYRKLYPPGGAIPLAIDAWLASAKVQRGATPPAVSEVRRELLELAAGTDRHDDGLMIISGARLRSLAAKLGGGS